MKPILIVTVILILVAVSVSFYNNKDRSSSNAQAGQTNKITNPTNDDSTTPTVDSETLSLSENYVQFSPEVLEGSTNTTRILFFYANWCPTCKQANDEFLEQSALLPENVTVIRVNYNDTDTDAAEKELAKKYAITYQHTFVQIDAQGTEVSKWNGGKIKELLTNIK